MGHCPKRRTTLEDFIPPDTDLDRETEPSEHKRPDWRWIEADKLRQFYDDYRDYPADRSDDPILIKYLLPFLDAYAKCNDLEDEKALKHKYPDLLDAMEIFMTRRVVAYEIEALAIAGMEAKDISRLLAMRHQAIWLYLAVWFDIGPVRDDGGWILSNVILPKIYGLWPSSPEDVGWKLVGLHLGPEVLITVLDPARPNPPKAARLLQTVIRKKTTLDAMVSILRRKPSPENEASIIATFLAMDDGQANVAERSEKDENLMSLMQVMGNSFRMAEASSDFDGVEKRAHEQLVKTYRERKRLIAEADQQALIGKAKSS